MIEVGEGTSNLRTLITTLMRVCPTHTEVLDEVARDLGLGAGFLN